jgi:hypothetical protein
MDFLQLKLPKLMRRGSARESKRLPQVKLLDALTYIVRFSLLVEDSATIFPAVILGQFFFIYLICIKLDFLPAVLNSSFFSKVN